MRVLASETAEKKNKAFDRRSISSTIVVFLNFKMYHLRVEEILSKFLLA